MGTYGVSAVVVVRKVITETYLSIVEVTSSKDYYLEGDARKKCQYDDVHDDRANHSKGDLEWTGRKRKVDYEIVSTAVVDTEQVQAGQ